MGSTEREELPFVPVVELVGIRTVVRVGTTQVVREDSGQAKISPT